MGIRWLLPFCLAGLVWAGQPIGVAVDKPLMTLNPLLLAREVEAQVVDLVFDRLVALNERGDFEPQILEGWEISGDGRNILLKVRPGLVWQDGSPIEAEDLVATWRLLSLPEVRKVNDLVGVRTLDSLVAEGPLKARIRLKKARASLLADLYNFQPVPRRLYAQGGGSLQHRLNYAPVGSGPYRVVPGAKAGDIHLLRWSGYRGPHPGRWEGFRFSMRPPDPQAYGRQLKAGQYHFGELDWFSHYLLRRGAYGDGNLVAQSSPLASFGAFWFNCRADRSLLADNRIRMALAEALPWAFLISQRRLRPEELANCLWPPQSWVHGHEAEALPRLERAASLLDEAGWRTGADGLRRDAAGRKLRLVMYSTHSYTRHDPAQDFKEALQKIGVDLDLRRTLFDEVLDRAAKGEGDIWDYAWTTGLDPDNESPLFTSEGIKSGANIMGYQNAEVDRLFDEGRHEMEPSRRRAIYRRINRLVQGDHPMLQLTYGVSYLALDRKLRGAGFNQLGQTYGYVPGRRGWWLETQ